MNTEDPNQQQLEEGNKEDMEDSSSSSDDSSDEDDSSEEDSGQGHHEAAADGGGDDNAVDGEKDEESDDEEEEMEEDGMGNDELLAQLSDTNYKLSGDPFSYDLYVEKIKLLSRLGGDIEALRETRQKLSQLYPLTEKLWLDWIHDEIVLMGSGGGGEGGDRARIVELFDRAVKDYLSVEIWLEYAQFQLSEITKPNGIESCRALFERALSAGGLHVPMGAVLWDMYREFEGAVLGMMSSGDAARQEEQESRYIALCKRQLAVPLFGMENTYKNLKSKIKIDEGTETAYRGALEKLKSINEFEDKLVDENLESRAEAYRAYLEYEKGTKSNPARRICLYERAVADNPLDSNLWLDFYEYTLGINLEELALGVISRASRNCPWTISVWTNYLCHMEQSGANQEEIKEIFEKAILYCSTGEQTGTLWLKYLEILKRRINFDEPDESVVKLFDKTVAAADSHLRQLLEEPNDYICQLLLFQARTHTHLTKSVEGARGHWLELFKRGYGAQFKVWLQAFTLEVQYGASAKDLRKRFEKGLASVKDYPMLVVDAWQNWERDHGDVKTLRACEGKIEKWVKKAEEDYQKQQQAQDQNQNQDWQQQKKKNSFTAAPSSSRGRGGRREGLGFKRQRFNNHQDQEAEIPEKRARGQFEAIHERKGGGGGGVDEPDREFKIPALPPSSKSAGTADKGQNKKNSTTAAASKSKKSASESDYKPEEWKLDPKDNDRTVFVSNLDKEANEELLREFFTDSGAVEAIRIARNFKGDSKRYGYVCFRLIDDAKKALTKDRQPLLGRPVFVSPCDPDRSHRKSATGGGAAVPPPAGLKHIGTGLEKDKLFVKGIPFTTKSDELKSLFETYAPVKEVRLVTYRNGESKGLAYIDFYDEQSARLALSKTDGLEFQGATLSVAFSNPPRRPASGAASRDEFKGPSVRRAPTMFVPRSLQMTSKPAAAASSTSSTATPMSNQDFRNLFKR